MTATSGSTWIHLRTGRKRLPPLQSRLPERDPHQSSETGDDYIQFVRDERRRELCFEGHRWFDLRRYNVCEKKPFTGTIRNTYTEFGDWQTASTTYTYELKAGDPAWTLQIPYEVIQFEELTPNPRNERTYISILQFN